MKSNSAHSIIFVNLKKKNEQSNSFTHCCKENWLNSDEQVYFLTVWNSFVLKVARLFLQDSEVNLQRSFYSCQSLCKELDTANIPLPQQITGIYIFQIDSKIKHTFLIPTVGRL